MDTNNNNNNINPTWVVCTKTIQAYVLGGQSIASTWSNIIAFSNPTLSSAVSATIIISTATKLLPHNNNSDIINVVSSSRARSAAAATTTNPRLFLLALYSQSIFKDRRKNRSPRGNRNRFNSADQCKYTALWSRSPNKSEPFRIGVFNGARSSKMKIINLLYGFCGFRKLN